MFQINDTGVEHKIEMFNTPQQQDTADELIESGNNADSEISATGTANGPVIMAIIIMFSIAGILLVRKQR